MLRGSLCASLTLALLLLSIAPVEAGLRLGKHDCTSVEDYLATNAVALTALASISIQLLEAVGSDPTQPVTFDAKLGLKYTGIAVSILRGWLAAGVSPLGALNLPLGLVCLRITDTPDAPG